MTDRLLAAMRVGRPTPRNVTAKMEKETTTTPARTEIEIMTATEFVIAIGPVNGLETETFDDGRGVRGGSEKTTATGVIQGVMIE